MASWVLVLVQAFADVLQHANLAPLRLTAVFALLLGAASLWCCYWLLGVGRGSFALLSSGLVVLTALLTTSMLLLPPRYFGLLIFASVVAGASLPRRSALPVIVAITGLAAAVDAVRAVAPIGLATDVLEVAVGGAGAAGIAFLLRSYAELQEARDHGARLAVAEERLRLARDLHDELGQRLSLIVLKSEMIRMDVPDDAIPRLGTHADDIVVAARAALDSLRDVVTGFRQPNLEAELASAQSSLKSAGIDCECRNSVGVISASTAAVLAWSVREATTNVLRHSQAIRCFIQLRRVGELAELEVRDDGRGAADLTPGNGLQGIDERAQRLGGRLLTSATGAGFTLRLIVPAG